MNGRSYFTGLGLLASLASPPMALGAVTVQFIAPERYTDVGHGYDSERHLLAIEKHFKTLGQRCLKADESLELRVLDVDLAGQQEWWQRTGYDVRVMRDISWPRLSFDYQWRTASGKILGQGREQVSDMNYLWRSAWVRNSTETLPYEKAMLRDWFERRFCQNRLPQPNT